MKTFLLLLLRPLLTLSNDEKIDSDVLLKSFPVKPLTDVTSNVINIINSTAFSHDFDTNYSTNINYYDDKIDPFSNPFMIQSFLPRSYEMGLCLEERFDRSGQNKFIAAVCDPQSPSQHWIIDIMGYIRNVNNPHKCVKKQGPRLVIDNCSKTAPNAIKMMRWIYSSDATIRLASNALFALSINKKFSNASMKAKKTAPVQFVKLNRRFPLENEQWMFFPLNLPEQYYTNKPTNKPTNKTTHESSVKPTITPTHGPSESLPKPPTLTAISQSPSVDRSSYPSIISSYPLEPNHTAPGPTAQHDGPKKNENNFNIQLMNMGGNHLYDDVFYMAKMKIETLIVGDLLDQEPFQNSNGDWFYGTWPNNKTNVHIDDVLIGYEISDIDGIGQKLGFAGPVYTRLETTTVEGGVDKLTTISGIMKFDNADFEVMDYNDISLIVLHEMAHVLGLGSLWSTHKCGTSCDETTVTNQYECFGANHEYNMLKNHTNQTLFISSKDCAHWSEQSFANPFSSEIMTPFFEANKYQPFSRVSVAGLADLGYMVNMEAADPVYFEEQYYGGEDEFNRMMKVVDKQSPKKTFVLDSSNIIHPEVYIIEIAQ